MTADSEPMPLNIQAACVFGGGNGWGARIVAALDGMAAGIRIIEIDASHEDIVQAITHSHLVFMAIPDSAINPLLLEYGAMLSGKILLDCATNKTGFGASLRRLAESGVSVCSTHPMAASSGAMRGQNALIMPIGRNAAPAVAAAEQIYRHLGMHCASLDFSRHTDVMCILQMLPHVIQRLTIDALGHGLREHGIGIEALENLASANYLLAELGLGRVAAQRTDVSAGIIATALHEPFGQQLLERLQTGLQSMKGAGNSREALGVLFNNSVQQLDPSGQWRLQMADKTEAALVRLGNLRSRSLTIEAPNRIGMLRDILSVLANHRIDMTALDSQLSKDADGSERVNFDIAISNQTVPYSALTAELEPIGAHFVRDPDPAA
jgi:prephenate dehydrogenase